MSDHARRYLETNGAVGHIWRKGSPTLVLTTMGRRSGEQRSTGLIYGKDGDRLIVVASKAGFVSHPWWYLNLVEQPRVEVQLLAERFTALASTATPEEKPRLWETMAAIWPAFQWYQRKTKREIPVVILEREPSLVLANA